MTSVQRAGHSNWIIGWIAAFAILAFTVSILIGIQRYEDQDARLRSERQTNQQLHIQQRQLAAQQKQEKSDLSCIATYNANVNRRNQRVNAYFLARTKASHRLTVAQIRGLPMSRQNALRRAFLRADNGYLEAQKRFPIPTFNCAERSVGRVRPIPIPTVPPSRRTSVKPQPTVAPPPKSGGPPKAHRARPPHGRARGHHKHHHPR